MSRPLLFSHTPTTAIYTLSLHDALPIFDALADPRAGQTVDPAEELQVLTDGQVLVERELLAQVPDAAADFLALGGHVRSEEHTSELQSHVNLVCRLLLEKKKHNNRLELI